ncbi:SRPBCC family protein [Streptomyces sp. SKN60]|uniref:SRPBCC family protein n=1 Tax=Streptomyces sp. SKN60 TaxID=2855506 RepID=UPI0027D254FC|nr:SRPBCC family protein [Streptomyces sp. SKN60]MCX2180578.1 SRPBCC family protein [Streptomyces sp. SKN60]
MSMVQETIRVTAPLRTVYGQWTRFEEFPRFMEGVEEVRQLDDRLCHWRTRVAGVTREFDTEIVDQLPDERISWRTVSAGVKQKGVVSFRRLDDEHTRVSLAMEVEPQGIIEKAGDALGFLEERVRGDLQRFKRYVEESDGTDSGWRGRLRPADSTGESPEPPEPPEPPERPGPYPGPLPDAPPGAPHI